MYKKVMNKYQVDMSCSISYAFSKCRSRGQQPAKPSSGLYYRDDVSKSAPEQKKEDDGNGSKAPMALVPEEKSQV